MDLSGLLEPIRLLDGYQALRQSLTEERDLGRSVPLPHAARIPVAAALAGDLARPGLYGGARSGRLPGRAPRRAGRQPGRGTRSDPGHTPGAHDSNDDTANLSGQFADAPNRG